ncbi:TIGR03936 family radical SAM-associated protein [Veillonella intestinalis]|uniref:TIGR03936 family radical SAM-associated protein n=1 Tax=Veillonella intestinalis TaxID=2941341 RepID=UPI00280A64FB|nr:TIGR03936 family radical SAM-associated protein [Veillonella intestinalis]
MKKLRLALSKGEDMRFLSHLDYAQAVERMIRRAAIKMAYSEGFNPHMKISFSSALALGITADVEYLDMDIIEDLTVADVKERLNQVAPPGLQVLDGREMPDRVKKLMAICNYAVYEVSGPVTAEADWASLLQPFNEATEIAYEKVTPKKTRTIDVKHFVKEPITARVEGDRVILTMGIGIYPEGTMKPGDVWQLGREKYGWPVTDGYSIHRQTIMVERDGQLISPLEVTV